MMKDILILSNVAGIYVAYTCRDDRRLSLLTLAAACASIVYHTIVPPEATIWFYTQDNGIKDGWISSHVCATTLGASMRANELVFLFFDEILASLLVIYSVCYYEPPPVRLIWLLFALLLIGEVTTGNLHVALHVCWHVGAFTTLWAMQMIMKIKKTL